MNRRQLKKALKFAVLQSTPDVLPKILPDYQPTETLGTIDRKAALGRTRWKVAACVMAAACVFCFSLFHLAQPKVDSLISIDVNPSIELQADKRDRVIESTALNSDAVKILDGLSLKNTDLNTATDAIIGSMVKNGYLPAGSSDNAILISVANNNAARAEQLQQKISTSVKTALKETNTGAKVLRQTDTFSTELQTFARQNNVSVGKADFVRKLTEKDSTLDAQELCKMSVKELSALIDEKELEISGVVVETDGKLSGVSDVPSGTDAVISSPASASSGGEDGPSSGGEDGENSKEGSGSESDDPRVLPADKPANDETPPPYDGEDEDSESEDDADKPQEARYCRRCGNWLSVCNRTCDPSKPEIYCEYCGRLLSVCNDTCETEIDFSERYCERCGRYKSVCKGTCDKTAPELYCTDCGRLKSVCLGSCEFYPTYEQVEYTYCERCGEPDFVCQDRCDPTAIRAYCKECGGLKTDHKPGCSQYRPSSSSEPESSSSSSEETPELYFCERCGRPESVCKDRCDKTKPDAYCRYCGELKTDHAEDCPVYPGESSEPPSSAPSSSAPASSGPASSSGPPSSSQSSSSGTSSISNKKIIR